MKDFVPLGSGNSRFLKTVNNAKTLYPTYDAFLNALVDGTLPIDLNGINSAGVAQMGTALNKANLLTDATAAALGLTGDPTVNDALGYLADVTNWHVWEKRSTVYSPVIQNTATGAKEIIDATSTSALVSVSYSSELNVDPGTLAVSLKDPQTVAISYDTYTAAEVLNGKYFLMNTNRWTNELIYCESLTSVTRENNGSSYPYVVILNGTYSIISSTGEANSELLGYVGSQDPNAYPQDGEQDGVHYVYVKQMGEAGVKIETGSYKGTGTYGASDPNILSFSFAPKFVWIYARRQDNSEIMAVNNSYGSSSSTTAQGFLIPELLTTSYQQKVAPFNEGEGYNGYAKKSADGKTLYWYHTINEVKQLNYNQYTYFYIALG